MTLIPKATVQRRLKNNRNSITHSYFEVKCTPKTSIANFGIRLLLPCATKLRQGNVLHLSVILFTGRGELCLSACWKLPHWADTPLGRHPRADTPQADTPPAVSAADGTHPTGMHSCYVKRVDGSHVCQDVRLLKTRLKTTFKRCKSDSLPKYDRRFGNFL